LITISIRRRVTGSLVSLRNALRSPRFSCWVKETTTARSGSRNSSRNSRTSLQWPSVDSRWWIRGRCHAKAQSRKAAKEKKKQTEDLKQSTCRNRNQFRTFLRVFFLAPLRLCVRFDCLSPRQGFDLHRAGRDLRAAGLKRSGPAEPDDEAPRRSAAGRFLCHDSREAARNCRTPWHETSGQPGGLSRPITRPRIASD
jgi:hypothetical protein